MIVVGSSDDFGPLFPDDFLEEIIGRVFVAWDRIPKPISETLETRITKLLRHQYAYDPVIKRLPFQVRRELPIDDPETGEELGRIDLCLLHGNDEDIYFAFECKRLNVTFPSGKFKSLVADYVGSKGMGCFVSQKYSSGQRSGGMIGYVFDGKIDAAKMAIENQLSEKATRLKLKSNGMRRARFVSERNDCHETLHTIGSVDFEIYHVLLSLY